MMVFIVVLSLGLLSSSSTTCNASSETVLPLERHNHEPSCQDTATVDNIINNEEEETARQSENDTIHNRNKVKHYVDKPNTGRHNSNNKNNINIKLNMKQELEKATRFHDFLDAVFGALQAHDAATLLEKNRPNHLLRQDQERVVLTAWLEYLGMNASAILSASRAETNWLYDVHQRTKAMAPSLFFKIWNEQAKPTTDEVQILLNIDDSALVQAAQTSRERGLSTASSPINENILLNYLFMEFRQRGFMMALLHTFGKILLGPLKSISFAIPSPSNLEVIAHYAPLLEMGAGSGYWSSVLQQHNVEITPYDAQPPKEGEQGMYFDRTFTHVHQGECVDIFDANTTNMSQRTYNNHTLLLVWPNNPDNVDNAPQFHSDRLPPLWDADCVRAFVAAGGTTVILVAERETNIRVLPHLESHPTFPDSGLCASRELQTLLQTDFELIHQMDIPTWYYKDDLTIWKKKPEKTMPASEIMKKNEGGQVTNN